MKKMIKLFLILISVQVIYGCSLVSPFKSVSNNKCSDIGGSNCYSVEENLMYSIEPTQETPQEDKEDKKEKKSKKKKSDKEEPIVVDNLSSMEHSDQEVERQEISRILIEQGIDSSITETPTMIQPSTYRIYVLPYIDNEAYYSARYIYITAGNPKWINKNYVTTSSKRTFRVDVPSSSSKLASNNMQTTELYEESTRNKEQRVRTERQPTQQKQEQPTTQEIAPSETVIDEEAIAEAQQRKDELIHYPTVKHRVNTHMLNCRQFDGMDSDIIAVFYNDEVLDVVNKDSDWWLINYYNASCYVNSKYLYSEPEL